MAGSPSAEHLALTPPERADSARERRYNTSATTSIANVNSPIAAEAPVRKRRSKITDAAEGPSAS